MCHDTCKDHPVTKNDALALAVYAHWLHNGHSIPKALAAVAEDHPDAKVREAAEFDFVTEALTAFCEQRLGEERAATRAG